MRILFLSRWYPFPADNGSKIRIHNLIRELSRNHEVWLVSFTDEQLDRARLDGMRELCARVETVAYRRFNPVGIQAITGLISPKPRSVVDTFSEELKQRVERVCAETTFDCVIASQVDMAPYALYAKDVPRILEEVEISIYAEQARRAQGTLSKLRKNLMWSKWRSYMRDTLAQFDGVTVVAEPEFGAIRQAAPGFDNLAVVPNGADLQRFTGNFGRPERDTLIYTGALTYYVNFDAMKFFIADVLPKIQAQRPQVKLLMAGRIDGVPVNDLPMNPAAIHAGYRKDIRPFVASGWVSVVPERVGGGTRIKVLESMALGTPVVATKWATVGLDVQQGYDILFADEPQALSGLVLSVLKDANLRETLRTNARKTVEAKYDWRVIGDHFQQFIEQTIVRSRQRVA